MDHDTAMKSPGPQPARLVSLDAYRGAVMLLMASGGLGLLQATRNLDPGSPWKWIGMQVEHTEWVGATLWDFIQPAFMFMVGVALAQVGEFSFPEAQYVCRKLAESGDFSDSEVELVRDYDFGLAGGFALGLRTGTHAHSRAAN